MHILLYYIGEMRVRTMDNVRALIDGDIDMSTKISTRKNIKIYRTIVKRIFDLVISALLFVAFLPIFLIIGLLIKLDDKGPVFYKQERTGKNGKIFKMYKFRSMNVLPKGLEMTVPHDKRITRVGKVLRKTSLDELPQIINILKGEMSIIGPRPWIPIYYENFTEDQKHRCDVLPGITGLAQSHGRNGLNIFEKINYDIKYAKNISFKMDLSIIFHTIKIVLKRDHAEIIQEDINKEINDLKGQFK